VDDVINGYNGSQFEKECLYIVLFGREGKRGILDNFIEFERKRIEEGFKVVEIEAKKSVNFEGIEVTGKMDRIEENGEILRIIDLKSAKSTTEWDRFQVKSYIKIEEGTEGDKKVEGALCHILNRFKFDNITLAGEDFYRVRANIEELREKMSKWIPLKMPANTVLTQICATLKSLRERKMANNLPDEEQRKEALNKNASFVVVAPAGSGKTELLIKRFLTLLKDVKSIDQIVALTFTRKAAQEMRERILKAIESAF